VTGQLVGTGFDLFELCSAKCKRHSFSSWSLSAPTEIDQGELWQGVSDLADERDKFAPFQWSKWQSVTQEPAGPRQSLAKAKVRQGRGGATRQQYGRVIVIGNRGEATISAPAACRVWETAAAPRRFALQWRLPSSARPAAPAASWLTPQPAEDLHAVGWAQTEEVQRPISRNA
jgi:hypothetical protein